MVRIKHRYLLVNILYPENPQEPINPFQNYGRLPDVVQFHQPTGDGLTSQSLLRAVREQITVLYGDYGAGVTASGLSGMIRLYTITRPPDCSSTSILELPITSVRIQWFLLVISQIFFSCDLHLHPPNLTRKLPSCLGDSYHDDAST